MYRKALAPNSWFLLCKGPVGRPSGVDLGPFGVDLGGLSALENRFLPDLTIVCRRFKRVCGSVLGLFGWVSECI